MDEGRVRCPVVPAPERKPVTSLIRQPEAWPAAIIAPGAMVCLGSDGSSTGVAAAGMYAMGRTGPVKFIRQADAASHHFL